jgi:hypothetical protein
LEILVGGLGGTQELAYLEYMLNNLTRTPSSVPGFATAKDLFIGIAFHPYSNPAENLAFKLAQYDEILLRYNWTNVQGARHWITEIGGDTESPKEGTGGFLADRQRKFASLLMKQMVMASAWGAEGFNIWTYRDFEPPGSYMNEYAHTGIVFTDGSWKPVTYACNWSNTYLGNGQMNLMPVIFPRPITGIVAQQTVLIEGAERWVVVLWNPQHQGSVQIRIEMSKSIRQATQFDYGSDHQQQVAGAGQQVKLNVGYDPVLVVIDSDPGAEVGVFVEIDFLGTLLGIVLITAGGLMGLSIIHSLRARIRKAEEDK